MAYERPRRLTLGVTILLAGLSLGLAFAVALVLGAKPAPERGPAMVTAPRGPAVDLEMASAGTLPTLRRPPAPAKAPSHKVRRPRRHVQPAPRVVSHPRLAPTAVPVPVALGTPAAPRPVPRPTPRPVAPVVRRPVATPVPTPKPPAPTPEPAGQFDTTGAP